MKKSNSLIALIPARSGSKRTPDKNIKPLAGHPLIAYTIAAARQSGIFSAILVATDSEKYAHIASQYGAEVPFLRPPEVSGDLSPDFEWLNYTLNRLKDMGREYDCFCILRPTSPFRLPETIQRAWKKFQQEDGFDSLRAVELCSQHPAKMWEIKGKCMTPLLPGLKANQPWHSTPYQDLPKIYVQNASLEIAWSRVIFENQTISGNFIIPFFTKDFEGFDINQPYDWELAEKLVQSGQARLPSIK